MAFGSTFQLSPEDRGALAEFAKQIGVGRSAVIVSTPSANWVWYCRREREAGPFSTRPLVSKCEPWQGQT